MRNLPREQSKGGARNLRVKRHVNEGQNPELNSALHTERDEDLEESDFSCRGNDERSLKLESELKSDIQMISTWCVFSSALCGDRTIWGIMAMIRLVRFFPTSYLKPHYAGFSADMGKVLFFSL